MKFWKMNGAGNDFILINNIEENLPIESIPEIARTLCERRLSIGADGFMLIERPTAGVDADYKMLFYNSDGSLGEMCGNGARCICRYGYENGLAGDIQKVETTAGVVVGERISERQYRIRLNDPCNFRFDEKIAIDGKDYTCSYVELGNPGIPHVAIEVKGLKGFDEKELFEIGRKLRYYKGYPRGANINFYEPIAENHLYEKTYERGVEDFTYACGTGTGAVVTILTLKGKVSGKSVKVDVRGGQLSVDVEKENEEIKNVFLIGPTNIVAKGEVWDEELRLNLF